VVNATPRPLYPREGYGTHCKGDWVGPRAGLEGVRKRSPPPAFDPRTFQPVVSRYTDCAIPAHIPTIGTRRISAVFNWMEGGRAPDSVRMRWRRAESLPKPGMELPPAIPQSGNHCADRQLARQGGETEETRCWVR
jgi:hypothetical protein